MADYVQTGPFSRKSAEGIERLPGQLINALGLGQLGGLSNYLGSKKAAEDYTNLLRGKFPTVGRPAAAATPRTGTAILNGIPVSVPYGSVAGERKVGSPDGIIPRQGPTPDIYLQPGVGYFDRTTGGFRGGATGAPQLPPPGLGTAPIIQGTRDGVTADRTQSDEYRTQLGQYEALQKKKQYEEADALGMQIWQQKYGKTPMAGPESRNPLMQSTFGYQSFERPSYEGQAPVSLEDSFSVAANSVPAPWNRQGAMVDLNRGAPELFAKQAEKTNPMNAFSQGEGISGAVKEFLGRMGR